MSGNTYTRVPPTEITGIMGALAKRFSKKMLGQVPEPLGVMWHNRRVLKAFFGFSSKAGKWDACDTQVKTFAPHGGRALTPVVFVESKAPGTSHSALPPTSLSRSLIPESSAVS